MVYLDETWLNSGHTRSRQWQTKEGKGKVQKGAPPGKGQRLIHTDVGGKEGFVEGAELTFISKTGNPDYHQEMNGDV